MCSTVLCLIMAFLKEYNDPERNAADGRDFTMKFAFRFPEYPQQY